jgi:CheY-like chemotaxis protein
MVDDEAYFRRFVGQLLRSQGISKVVEARDGQEALEQFALVQPDIIILDINMPRMDGMSALRALRAVAGDRPIIMLTSISDEMTVEKCVDEGATFFIRKDVPAQQLSAAMSEVLVEFTRGPQESP